MKMKQIRKAAVIGAGVMGSGIAAQLANAGIEVELLDQKDVAQKTLDKMAKAPASPLMHRKNAKLIRAGNADTDLERVKDCDIIIEAIIEDPAIKSELFRKIDALRKEGSIVASNTSTLPLTTLTGGQSDQFKKDFVITHFFNPPRQMPLVEIVTSEANARETVDAVTNLVDHKMGKHVIVAKDSPGFITTRIGAFWLQAAVNEAYNHGLTVEEADAVAGRPMGVPKTGVFGLRDLVGLDLLPHVGKSLQMRLAKDDRYNAIAREFPVLEQMLKDGYTGRKPGSKGGFYRMANIDGKKVKEAIDLNTGEFHAANENVRLECLKNAREGGLKALIDTEDKGGKYAWAVLKQTLLYSLEIAPEVASNITAVDEAMKLGYNWKQGPFEIIDAIGVDYFIKRLEKDGEKVPELLKNAAGRSFYRAYQGKLQQLDFNGEYEYVKRPEGVLLLSDIKRASEPVATSRAANILNKTGISKKLGSHFGADLWDIGDGVLCLEFTSKGHTVDPFTLDVLNKAIDIIGDGKGKYKALVIHHEGDDFSLGANIGLAVKYAAAGQYWAVENYVQKGQDIYKRLKDAPFPTVAAPTGRAFGGSCEILLHCSHVQAHAEINMGLIEATAGVLPAWGGSTTLLARAQEKIPGNPTAALTEVFNVLSQAKVSTSAQDAKDLLYLQPSDGITMNRERLLADAKAKALELVANGYAPPKPVSLDLTGPAGYEALTRQIDAAYGKGGILTPYDVVVLDRIAHTLSGGDSAGPGKPVSDTDLRKLEIKNVMKLLHDQRTLDRIESKLKYAKILREPPEPGKTAQQLRDEAEEKRAGKLRRLFNKLRWKKKKPAAKPAQEPSNSNQPVAQPAEKDVKKKGPKHG
jgi:3-hydroxyacyl-CoA dehydrogenase